MRTTHNAIRGYWWLFILPTLAAFVLAFAVPFAMGVALSFTEFTTVADARWTGVSNYVRAFSGSGEFLGALWFTFKFTVVSVATVNLFAFALALILTRDFPGVTLFRSAFFLPNLIGGIVLGWIWQLIFNGFLNPLGRTLTGDPRYGFWGLVILMNWQMIGYMMMIYIAGLQSVPEELYDAAAADGAGRLSRLRHVTLPMVAPSTTICVFLTLTNAFKLFDQNLALTAGAPSKKTAMLALDIYNTFYGRSGWQGVGQAKAVVFFVLAAGLSLTQLLLSRRGES